MCPTPFGQPCSGVVALSVLASVTLRRDGNLTLNFSDPGADEMGWRGSDSVITARDKRRSIDRAVFQRAVAICP
jgi:hypothetical protein